MLSLLAMATDLAVEKIELFLLALVRISFIIYLLPAFSLREVPGSVKGALSLTLAFLAFPQMPTSGFVIADSTVFFMMLVLEQCMIGAMIGFASSFLLYFVSMGGSFIARDMGIMQGGADPLTDEPSDTISSLLTLIFMIIFLEAGGHYSFIRVLFDSFQYIPIGHLVWDTRSFAGVMTLLSASSLVLAFKLAAPVMGVIFIVTVVLGLMNRVMPQLDVWILGIPLKIGLGVLVIIYSFPLMKKLFDSNLEMVQRALLVLLKAGGGHG